MAAFLAPLAVWGTRVATLISGLWIGEKMTGVGNKGNENNPLPKSFQFVPTALMIVGGFVLFKMIRRNIK